MGNRLTSKLSLLFLSFVVVLLVFPAMAFGETITPDGTTSTSTPTIQSDQADYPPGATVTLTGSNWQPGESVNISVNDDAGKTWDRNVDVTADDSGAIRDEFQLPDWFVAQYSVKATGVQSGETTTSFTDGNIRVKLTGGPTSASFQVRGVYGNMTCASPPQPSQTSVTVTNSPTTVASADGTQSVQITAPNIAGYTFSGWSGGASGQTVCVTGSSGTTNIDANYTSAPTITNTTLSAASATGTYGGTTNTVPGY